MNDALHVGPIYVSLSHAERNYPNWESFVIIWQLVLRQYALYIIGVYVLY